MKQHGEARCSDLADKMRRSLTYGDSGPVAKTHTLVVAVSEVEKVVRSGYTVTLDEYRRMTG